MPIPDHFPIASWMWRVFTGKIALRVYSTIALLLVVTSVGVRIYTYVLTRRMEAVIAGLSRLQIDRSGEEALRAVPYLSRSPWGREIKRTPETGQVDIGAISYYTVEITNELSFIKFNEFLSPLMNCCAKTQITKNGYERNWILALESVMGFRYVYFGGSAVLLDGRVSSIRYGVADRLGFPRAGFQMLSVKSAHSFYAPQRREFEVESTDDESPQYRVGGNEYGVGVSYTYDAPQELTSRAFQVDLSCFWGLRGCRHVKQIAPQLWEDRNRIEAATLARLQSEDPCPDRILAGRLRYLPDVNVLELQSKGLEPQTVIQGNSTLQGIVTKYEPVVAIRGGVPKGIQSVWAEETVPFPGDYRRRIPNRGLRWASPGEQVLVFSNMRFDSCGIVSATPSAIGAVRRVETAPRREEDQLVFGLQ